MAVVWGRKLDGKDGAMTEADVVAFLFAKSGWRDTDTASKKAFKNAANYMFAHNGSGGGTTYHFDGKMVYHCTENRGEATVFFTCANGNIASIVGIGSTRGLRVQPQPILWYGIRKAGNRL